jgi:hypothetical protein
MIKTQANVKYACFRCLSANKEGKVGNLCKQVINSTKDNHWLALGFMGQLGYITRHKIARI